MSVTQRALVAKRLLDDEGLQSVFDDIRNGATATFLSASASMAEIEAAHERVRAVQVVLDAIEDRLTDKAIEEKRQHRGND